MIEKKINQSSIILTKGDITLMDLETIVYYARHDLALGSGLGNAIAIRGGSSIQEDLNTYKPVETCAAVLTNAGDLRSKYIIHAVGPRFQENDLEEKLKITILNVLSICEERDIHTIGFPPMGTGFYGIPLNLCAQIMLEILINHLKGKTSLEKVYIVVTDTREYNAFNKYLYQNKETGIEI